MILCLGTTPAAQRVMVLRNLALDAVNRAVTTLDGAAGKSINVAKVLKTLGEQPLAMGFLGGDRGEELRRLLQEKGIDLDFVSVSARTRQCITVLAQDQGSHTELVEESLPVRPSDYDALIGRFRQRVKTCRAVILSGSITPGGPTALYRECAALAREAGALCVVDAQGAPLREALQASPGLVKPNRAELSATVGRELKDEADVKHAMAKLCESGTQRVVVTAGREPTLAFDGKHFWRILPPSIAAVNPIGSGDAFTAGLVWRLLRGEDLGEACRWASAGGAANALTLMPGDLNAQDVTRLAREVVVQQE